MAQISYEPWTLLNQLTKELNRAFEGRSLVGPNGERESVTAADWVPAVDIREEDDRFVIRADIPGVDPKEIQVNMENGILTISGSREEVSEEERKHYKRIECARGSFLRRFTLPDTADPDKITAKAVNGVLEVVIPKQAHVQPRKITVEAPEA